ncbi:transcriptional regulator FtrA [Phenylobacterium sp.]|jgi:AraC family transcriptional activator FtrA|uniref:transcriptional regulator FtrA n=1 Tax=Phenylobacterium sp. TaxID=1871053 RepID=UPI002F429F6B
MSNLGATRGPLVVVVAYDRLCIFEFGIAYEVFGLPRPEMGEDWYRFAVAAAEPVPLRGPVGLEVLGDGGLELLAAADLIVLPGWRDAREDPPAPLVEALQTAQARGARIMSLCSGVFVLAKAGLLDGRTATTHWRYASLLRERYPDIRVDADVLYADEGAILSSAGSAAGIDLCLHVVRHDFGPAAANVVARRLVVPPHREGGQAQFIERAVAPAREGARLGPLFDWIRERLHEPLPLKRLAAQAGMSERTLIRRFKAATGLSPGEWLLEERLAQAKTLLEESRRPIDDVAEGCGLGSGENLRRHFRRRFDASPGRYRARFGRAPAGDHPTAVLGKLA